MVDDLNDGGQAAGVRAVTLEEEDTSNLYVAPVGRYNRGVAHCVGRNAAVGWSVSGKVESGVKLRSG